MSPMSLKGFLHPEQPASIPDHTPGPIENPEPKLAVEAKIQQTSHPKQAETSDSQTWLQQAGAQGGPAPNLIPIVNNVQLPAQVARPALSGEQHLANLQRAAPPGVRVVMPDAGSRIVK